MRLISRVLTFICFGISLHSHLGFDLELAGQTKPVFQSITVTTATAGHSVKIEANIKNAKHLYLVADDAGDGYSFDHCDWANPLLVKANGESMKLTDLKWKQAVSGWGTVGRNRNCTGQRISINDKVFEYGIGTHANSHVHFELPKNHEFVKFQAVGGIDNSGSDQGGGDQASVRFLVFTEKPPANFLSARRATGNPADHEIAKAISQFDVHPELEIGLFASEPMMVNPTNIDIDHLGRVWVCEVVNYRGKRNTRREGDRILILEDTDGDAKADKQTVFYQGRDIDSVHGICVLGDRAIVSAGSEVFYLIDENGDSKADKKELLFTGISGAQHDHGIHAFVFGPDGKLYFNFGNSGRQIKDKNGKLIIDQAGRTVTDQTFPYKQGMIFRCNLDGSEFETLAWNFRNNWEVCVDSIGRMWQSDNDDDGNRGVRINFVMPFGNYGYLDEMTNAGWRSPRTGMAKEIPKRHWHLNDPGVVPNLLQTGAGSPTGICFYEGDALPKAFHNQILHCDAGPNIVRAYPIEPDGFGYKATTLNIMDGSKHNKWFRPSDVCVAPDGSIFVADWYDPGVGGHGMGDVERGRLFRVTSKGKGDTYRTNHIDLETVAGAIEALKSPNQATRYLAWQKLSKAGRVSTPALMTMLKSPNAYHASRAIWLLSKSELAEKARSDIFKAAIFDDPRPLVREAAIKALFQLTDGSLQKDFFEAILANEAEKLHGNIKRELVLAINWRNPNQLGPGDAKRLLPIIKSIKNDRWALEALGIALEEPIRPDPKGVSTSPWDDHLPALIKELDDESAANVTWRSRSKITPQLLADLIRDEQTTAEETLRYFRAFDFQDATKRQSVLAQLAFTHPADNKEKSQIIMRESLTRLDAANVSREHRVAIEDFIHKLPDNDTIVVEFTRKFSLAKHYSRLVKLASDKNGSNRSAAVDALIALKQVQLLHEQLKQVDDETFSTILESIASVPKNESVTILAGVALTKEYSIERRKLATRRLGDLYGGCQLLLSWAEKKTLDESIKPAMIAALHHARWNDISKKANELFPITKAKGDKPLPKIQDLVRRRGDVQRGLSVFKKEGTCATCHQVNGAGKQVGPDLSEIGSKLSKTGMYESILFPSAAVSHNFEMWRVTTLAGEMIDGVIESESADTLTLLDVKGNAIRIATKDIDEKEKQKVSLMPNDLHASMTEEQLVDVVEYLMTLRKKK